ncbi:helix-turn-helix transcriptional regulator [Lentisphaera profundi]|uniref:Helix-turn-helix transcriptional regulator n=1 Tax=Lentisphaera profundi TaxID=1658616 RepID=A0ABY7VTK4_9BACT|nr:helix-turn-helix transcriptional regulator [Lentisphaera profundi]WDE97535.1 helix-turn-helix transcriptional regulator [Lentisphaera profundi]
MTDINKIVSDNIRKFRLEKKITQEGLALESGLHRAYIGQVERNEKNIGLSNLQIIAKTLKVDLKDFLDEN